MMTNQEIFDRVWKCFIVDKQPRALSDKGYLYIPVGENSVGCAVGCCLTPEMQAEFHRFSTSIVCIYDESPELFNRAFTDDQLDLLSTLQCWHDDRYDILSEQNLRQIGLDFGLTVPE